MQTAIDTFGTLDVLVNNAGILRDRMLFNMDEDEWDAVIRVHLKGTFAPMRWRGGLLARAVEGTTRPSTRASSTRRRPRASSATPGQSNYGAAKSGIATLSIIAAKELGRYGVTVNAIAPGARTRMTENLGPPRRAAPEPGEWDERAPENIAPLVTWLASPESAGITGQVFLVGGGRIADRDAVGRAAPASTTGRAGTPPSSAVSSRRSCGATASREHRARRHRSRRHALGSSGEIHPETLAAWRELERRGVAVLVATGRRVTFDRANLWRSAGSRHPQSC